MASEGDPEETGGVEQAAAPDVTAARRLHPLSWLFATAKVAQGFILPWILVLFASGGSNYELWATLVIVPAAFGATVKYLVFRYRLGADEMVVRDGVLIRNERHIPYARIQNIDLVQNPLHRLLRVALVRVETSSGSKPEAVLRVLSIKAVEEMRARVFAGRRATESATSSVAVAASAVDDEIDSVGRRTLLRLPTSDIVRLGIVSNKGMVVVGAAMGLLWQGSRLDWVEQLQDTLGSGREMLSGAVVGGPVLVKVLLAAAVFLVAIILLRAFSIAWFMVQLHGFHLARGGEALHATYGLLNRVSRTIPISRIQVLSTRQSPLHRWFRRQSVELQTVGSRGLEDADLEHVGAKTERQWLAPMIEVTKLAELLQQVDPEVRLADLEWRPLAALAWRRVFKRWLLAVAVLTLPLVLLVDVRILVLTVVGAALAYLHSRLLVKHTGYSLTPWGLVFRSGWWDRTLKIVRYGKIQTVALAQSPFDRRRDMASVRVDTAGSSVVAHTVSIPYLDAAVAADVTRRLYAEASRRAFNW